MLVYFVFEESKKKYNNENIRINFNMIPQISKQLEDRQNGVWNENENNKNHQNEALITSINWFFYII